MAKSSGSGKEFRFNITAITKGFEAAVKKVKKVWRAGTRELKKDYAVLTRASDAVGRGMALMGAAGTAAMGLLIRSAAQLGDELQKTSKRTGLSVEALSEWAHAAELSDTNLQGLEKGLKRMARIINDARNGLQSAQRPLGQLGLGFEDLQDLSPEKQFETIMERLAGVADETTRSALAQEIFGRAGTDLLPIIADGAENMRAMREEAKTLGLTLSTEAADRAAKFGDELSTIIRQMRAFGQRVGDSMIQKLLPLGPVVKETVAGMIQWADANPALIRTIVMIAGAVSLFLTVAGPMLLLLPTLVSSLGIIGATLGALISPLGVLAALVGGAVVVAFRNWEAILRRIFGDQAGGGLAGRLRDLFGGELTLGQKVQLLAEIFRVLFERIVAGIEDVKNRALAIWEGLVSTFGPSVAAFLEAMKTGNFEPFVKEIELLVKGAISNVFNFLSDKIRETELSLKGLFSSYQNFKSLLGGTALGTFSDLGRFHVPGTFKIPGFAAGTNHAPGGASIVGENGPEIRNLDKGDTITPLSNLRPNVTAIIQLNGGVVTNARAMDELTSEIGRKLGMEIQKANVGAGFPRRG